MASNEDEIGSQLIGNALVLTGSVQSLPFSDLVLNTVYVQSKRTNAGTVYIVDYSAGNVVAELVAGASFSATVSNTDAFRVLGTANDVVYWGALVQ